MRQIVLDTETTGLELEQGHRIIEIGAVELVDRKITKNTFHCYLNPEREVDADALSVHGITNEFLANKPRFADILTEFLNFLGNSEIIAHNATFDLNFINHELQRISSDHPPLEAVCKIVDTLELARRKFPGQRNTLDAICKRYKIDLNERRNQGHGALLDAKLLARVYLLMTGGQSSLLGALESPNPSSIQSSELVAAVATIKLSKATPIIRATTTELTHHQNILANIQKSAKHCLWSDQ